MRGCLTLPWGVLYPPRGSLGLSSGPWAVCMAEGLVGRGVNPGRCRSLPPPSRGCSWEPGGAGSTAQDVQLRCSGTCWRGTGRSGVSHGVLQLPSAQGSVSTALHEEFGKLLPLQPVSSVNPSRPLAVDSLTAKQSNRGKDDSSAPNRIMWFESRREAEFPFLCSGERKGCTFLTGLIKTSNDPGFTKKKT